jgi:hypothetical protein
MSRRGKILIAAGIALGLAILIPVVHHYQLRFAVESYVAELKAKGEPMDLAQVIPPPVPPVQNSAPIFLKAAALLSTSDGVLNNNPPPAMRGVAPGRAMIGWAQPEICSSYKANYSNSHRFETLSAQTWELSARFEFACAGISFFGSTRSG